MGVFIVWVFHSLHLKTYYLHNIHQVWDETSDQAPLRDKYSHRDSLSRGVTPSRMLHQERHEWLKYFRKGRWEEREKVVSWEFLERNGNDTDEIHSNNIRTNSRNIRTCNSSVTWNILVRESCSPSKIYVDHFTRSRLVTIRNHDMSTRSGRTTVKEK